MTRTSRCISLTQDHRDLIDRVAHERRMKFSEILRIIIDFAIDRDAVLGLPFHAERVKSLQAELSSAQESIKSLEEQQTTVVAPTRVVGEVTNPATSAPESDHDKFLRYIGNLGTGELTPTTRLATRKVNELLALHSDWVNDVPADKRPFIEQGGSP